MNQFDRLRRELWLKTLPRRVLCAVVFGGHHRWDEPDAVIIDGPIDVPPREREWNLLAFHQQCDRCYFIRDVPYTDEQRDAALEAEIAAEEAEWEVP